MRTNINVQPGQVWVSSDPRRLRKFQVLGNIPPYPIMVKVLYPPTANPVQTVNPDGFQMTGTKGFTRIS